MNNLITGFVLILLISLIIYAAIAPLAFLLGSFTFLVLLNIYSEAERTHRELWNSTWIVNTLDM